MQHEHHRVPVTALAHWQQRFVLAGSGNCLQVHDVKVGSSPNSIQVFTEQAVHGIIVPEAVDDSRVVIWGGRLLRQLRLNNSDGSSTLQHEGGDIAIAKDWILDAAINPGDARRIAIITAHNALTIAIGGQTSMHLDLQDLVPGSNCILYCAQVTWLSPSSCLIASGTAFGDIIVWSCNISKHESRLIATHQTHYTFSAHDGSVFGLQIFPLGAGDEPSKKRRVLASCSDDRTVRLWDITDLSKRSISLEESQRETGFGSCSSNDTAAPACLAKTLGHISRIWHVKYVATSTQSCLLSFGEDATCITWILRETSDHTIDMQQTDLQRAHSGKHIWSAFVDDGTDHKAIMRDANNPHILTGGADGAIAVTEITDNARKVVRKLQPGTSNAASYRTYGFVSSSEVVAVTDDGTIELLTLNATKYFARSKTIATSVEQLRGYSTLSTADDLAFFAGRGQIYYYTQGDILHHVLLDGVEKVASLFAQSALSTDSSDGKTEHSLLITTVRSKCATWYQLRRRGNLALAVARTCVLEIPPGFIVTSFAEINKSNGQYFILGSRSGCVAIYALSEFHDEAAKSLLPASVIPGVHGIEAITSLQYHCGMLYSAGRDGTFAAHRIVFASHSTETSPNIDWNTIHQLTLPFGPNVEGIRCTEKGHIRVWGFRGKQFVVFDVGTQREIMAVECGGAHRSFTFNPGIDGGTFLWTKASELYYQHQEQLPYRLLDSGGHGREIKATAMSSINPALVATGAEDTNIKLLLLENGSWRCLHTLKKHITGIQHLKWSEDGNYLFSSGGVEEFYVWKVTHDLPVLDIGVVCESAYPHSTTSDLRIMNFDIQSRDPGFEITLVYSNSSIQKWHYLDKIWTRIAQSDYLTACLTQCLLLPSTHRSLTSRLLTASTDGHLVTWTTTDDSLSWHTRHKVHQSAILSLISHKLAPSHTSTDDYLLISGGDDNALGITRIFNNTLLKTLLVPRAHAAAVTALAITRSTNDHIWLASSSIDQRIKLWKIDISAAAKPGVEGIEIKLLQNVHTAVADVSSMEVVGEHRVLVCGVGMDLWRFDVGFFNGQG
ncbi:Putative WD40/YVTN repeat-like-containing domain superfamily [Septoria linicola]|uniref:WD40/YVTN repeat-like-containing domain superfamily n=1 Tax=Septoria linicola TaxID=215465 RepID=A0A9Q9EFE1_9PEZI|nr:putative WD40/YVTN repeat-like-containing domain superfamily [Septoria linicola]USW47118.1 Putative WD40/YVTN repeat-like-containing domain superfamily [Septoria linicola]